MRVKRTTSANYQKYNNDEEAQDQFQRDKKIQQEQQNLKKDLESQKLYTQKERKDQESKQILNYSQNKFNTSQEQKVTTTQQTQQSQNVIVSVEKKFATKETPRQQIHQNILIKESLRSEDILFVQNQPQRSQRSQRDRKKQQVLHTESNSKKQKQVEQQNLFTQLLKKPVYEYKVRKTSQSDTTPQLNHLREGLLTKYYESSENGFKYRQDIFVPLPYFILILIIFLSIVISFFAPFISIMNTPDILTQLIWNHQSALLLCFFIEIICIILKMCKVQAFKEEQNILSYWFFNKDQVLIYLINGFLITFWFILFYGSLKYTLISHSVIFFNIFALIYILLKQFTGSRLNRNEIMASISILLALFIINVDYEADKIIYSSNILIGNMLGLMSGLLGITAVFVFNFISKYQQNIRQVIFSQIFYANIILLAVWCVMSLLPSFVSIIPDITQDESMLGWLSKDFCFNLLVGGILLAVYFLYYIYAENEYHITITQIIFIIIPLTSQIISIFLEIDQIPGIFTFLGIFFIIIGNSVNIQKLGVKINQ